MNQLFTSISVQYKLFRQPNKFGDVLEAENELYVIVGIENFVLFTDTIKVNYTCQQLKQYNYPSASAAVLTSAHTDGVTLEQAFRYDDHSIHSFTLGSTQIVMEGDTQQFYKLVEFTEITLDGTNIQISVLGKLLVPAAPEILKKLYTTERKKRMQLRIV